LRLGSKPLDLLILMLPPFSTTWQRFIKTKATTVRPNRSSNVKFRRTQYPHHKNQHVPEKSGITFPMQSTHANVNSISDLATGNGNDATPFSQQRVVLTKQAYIELKWQAKYWQAQHEQSLKREAALKAQVEALEATVRDLNQRLYGTK